MFNNRDAHVTVYRVLDDVLACSSVPPGAKGAIFAVIDRLRATGHQSYELRSAEGIALALHELEAALRRSDQIGVQGAKRDLQSIACAWINMRVFQKDLGAICEGLGARL